DAHADTWDHYYGERYFHGTPFRRALEEGLLLPERSLLAGMRGPLYERADLDSARELGFELVMGGELPRDSAPLFEKLVDDVAAGFNLLELPDGTRRPLTTAERTGADQPPSGA